MSVDKIDRILRTGAGPEFSELYETFVELVCLIENGEALIVYCSGGQHPIEGRVIEGVNRCEATVSTFDNRTNEYQGADWCPERRSK